MLLRFCLPSPWNRVAMPWNRVGSDQKKDSSAREHFSLIQVKVPMWFRGLEYKPHISGLWLAPLHDWKPHQERNWGDERRSNPEWEHGPRLFQTPECI